MGSEILTLERVGELIAIGKKKAIENLSEKKIMSSSRNIECSAFSGLSPIAIDKISDQIKVPDGF